MDVLAQSESLAAEIRNSAWMVRHYQRGARLSIQRRERARAIRKMGLSVRHAFAASDDFEPLLVAVVDGLRPRPEETHF
jgi:hypothetical protein